MIKELSYKIKLGIISLFIPFIGIILQRVFPCSDLGCIIYTPFLFGSLFLAIILFALTLGLARDNFLVDYEQLSTIGQIVYNFLGWFLIGFFIGTIIDFLIKRKEEKLVLQRNIEVKSSKKILYIGLGLLLTNVIIYALSSRYVFIFPAAVYWMSLFLYPVCLLIICYYFIKKHRDERESISNTANIQ